jgi:hypothetical protein
VEGFNPALKGYLICSTRKRTKENSKETVILPIGKWNCRSIHQESRVGVLQGTLCALLHFYCINVYGITVDP